MLLPMDTTDTTNEPRQWHQLFGECLDLLLTPRGLEVGIDRAVMSKPPRCDVVLIRRKSKHWTPGQLECLPDGIRHSNASRCLLEVKISEGIDALAFQQVLGYDYFYARHHGLKPNQLQSFLLSSKTPATDILQRLDYRETEYRGVYTCPNEVVGRIYRP